MLTEDINRALNDPAASYWLKENILSALKRDPVDAAKDAEVLSLLLASRSSAMLRGDRVRALYSAGGALTE
jgi:hypothetical protein